jgi:glycosyltransferase involved in cell wall biosynthesis
LGINIVSVTAQSTQAYAKVTRHPAVRPLCPTSIDADPAPSSRTLVVIPARNEAAVVGDVVRRVRALGLSVVVVDDHSCDGTADIARRAGAKVLRLPFHAGSWVATQCGIRYGLEANFDYVVTMDADGQHYPEEVQKLFAAINQDNGGNVVIGACPSRCNTRRRFAWWVLRLLSGLKTRDLTSGFRIYDRQACQALQCHSCTLLEYQDVGVLLFLRDKGLKVTETDMIMQERCNGGSRIFSSWPAVAYYLLYSALLGSSRRFGSKTAKKQ